LPPIDDADDYAAPCRWLPAMMLLPAIDAPSMITLFRRRCFAAFTLSPFAAARR